MSIDLGNYVDVPTHLAQFRAKHPDGSLQPLNPERPFEVVTIGDQTFIAVVIAAYRSPDDPRPGVGMAYEPFPGKTPYTRDSELQNAETSAWGRAVVAVLAADSKAIASVAPASGSASGESPEMVAGAPATGPRETTGPVALCSDTYRKAILSMATQLLTTEDKRDTFGKWRTANGIPTLRDPALTAEQAAKVRSFLAGMYDQVGGAA